jgi:hypothetical protein
MKAIPVRSAALRTCSAWLLGGGGGPARQGEDLAVLLPGSIARSARMNGSFWLSRKISALAVRMLSIAWLPLASRMRRWNSKSSFAASKVTRLQLLAHRGDVVLQRIQIIVLRSPPPARRQTFQRIAQLKDIQRRSLRRERPAGAPRRRGSSTGDCTNTPLPGWMMTPSALSDDSASRNDARLTPIAPPGPVATATHRPHRTLFGDQFADGLQRHFGYGAGDRVHGFPDEPGQVRLVVKLFAASGKSCPRGSAIFTDAPSEVRKTPDCSDQ